MLKIFPIVLILISAITALSYQWSASLGLTGISMMYLLLVVGVAYRCTNFITVTVAVTSFMVINYFFVEPRFTFQVGHVASWASLISFLIVSAVITSLVRRLKLETFQSQQACLQAEFLKKLTEKLSYADSIQGLLEDCQSLLQQQYGRVVLVVKDGGCVSGVYPITSEQTKAIAWAQSNGKPLGVGTHNWPDSDFIIVPFNRLQSLDPVVFIPKVNRQENTCLFDSIKLAAEQIAVAYQHLLQKQKTQAAENLAREETVRSALLASIAHDMRTPLTSILGAATTLNQSELPINPSQIQHLASIISSQATHLARTTENILSLLRLESISKEAIPMELHSPEEIIGALISLYQYQANPPQLLVEVKQADLLIRANHDLVVLALTNLIENAIQANKENNASSTPINISVEAVQNKVIIQVIDSGRGFPEGFNASQIKKFESSHDKGFGLGLSIIEAVANLHDAMLTFEQGKQNGSVVSMIFNKPDINLNYVG